jgi:two-component sensor histidine kinase
MPPQEEIVMAARKATIHMLEFAPTFHEEADHRIANSLQIISSLVRRRARSGVVSNPQTFLLEIADRLETVGSLHRLLAQSRTGTVQLRSYLQEICERLIGALASGGTAYVLDCPIDCQLSPKTALPLALVTAELISNSLKYAHPAGLPAKIAIRCNRHNNGELTIVYEDDGVGFPEGFDVSHNGHIGMRFIRRVCESLAKNYEWQSDALGIRFEMTLFTSSELQHVGELQT